MPVFTELRLSFVVLDIAGGTLTIFLNLKRKFRNNGTAKLGTQPVYLRFSTWQ